MKRIISIIQQKGGVGKTSLAVNLAYELKARFPELDVAIADADPQQSAAKWISRGQRSGFTGLSAVDVSGDESGSKNLKKKLRLLKRF